MEQLTENLWTNSSTLFTYHSGIFVSKGNAVVIDPGLIAGEIAMLAEFVREQQWQVQAVILTHGHWDHVLGADAFPGAHIIAQREFLTSPRNDSASLARFIDKQTDLERNQPFVLPVPHETFDRTMQLTVGDLELELVHTPGHAPDHLFVHERSSGTVWTADMLTDEEIPYVIDNLRAFENTLKGINPSDFRLLVPCHGTPTRDAAEIRARIENDLSYVSLLRVRVERAVAANQSPDETKQLCSDIPYRQPTQGNATAHERNLETAYAQLGGNVDPEQVGWQRAWHEMTA